GGHRTAAPRVTGSNLAVGQPDKQGRDHDNRNRDRHPVLNRDAKNRKLRNQPLRHPVSLVARADTDLTYPQGAALTFDARSVSTVTLRCERSEPRRGTARLSRRGRSSFEASAALRRLRMTVLPFAVLIQARRPGFASRPPLG